jgi:hypothetical protein
MQRVARSSQPRLGLAFAAVLASLALLLSLFAASADAHRRHHHHHPHHGNQVSSNPTLALDWYDLTKQTVAAAAISEQVTQSRVWAVSWIAAARAVDDGHGGEFQTAAFATALHDALVALVPSQQPELDAALASTLATVPNGKAKQKGIYAGQQEAQKILVQRTGDGLDVASVSPPWTPPAPAPGVYQLTPPTFGPVVRAGQGNATAFLLASNSQFRPGSPPALNSPTYLKALAEVHAVGQDTSAVRTPAQLDTALFWAQASIDAYVQVLRGVLANTHHSLEWDAKAVAAFHVVTIDAQIAIYDAKYVYTFWRPVTAIRVGSVDQDPSWTPLIATPRHPEYPSGHAGYAGAAGGVLTALTGPWAPGPISATSSTAPGSVHTFYRWSTITQENIDGRVWEGVHFRFSDEIAAKLGKKVAAYDLQRLYKLGL